MDNGAMLALDTTIAVALVLEMMSAENDIGLHLSHDSMERQNTRGFLALRRWIF
jgi:hypothetical protein